MGILNIRWILFSGIFIGVFFASCTSDIADSRVCTAVFKTYSITVLNAEDQPAESVEITVFNKESGKVYPVCNSEGFSPANCHSGESGQYVIFHDAFQSISSDGEAIIVEGQKGNLSFSKEYIFRFDGCHIRHVSGPDTVQLQKSN